MIDKKSTKEKESEEGGGGGAIIAGFMFVFLIIFGIVSGTVQRSSKKSDFNHERKNPLAAGIHMPHMKFPTDPKKGPESPTDAEGEENLETV